LPQVGYTEVATAEDTVEVGGEYGDGRIPNLVGHCLRLSDYGAVYGPTLRVGEDTFFEDTWTDPLEAVLAARLRQRRGL
jgi:hypothetical protein